MKNSPFFANIYLAKPSPLGEGFNLKYLTSKHIPFNFKKTIVTIASSLIRIFINIFKYIGIFLSIFKKPINLVSKLLFNLFILPTYKVYLKIKKTNGTKKERKHILADLITSKNAIHVFIVLVATLITITNLNTKSVLAENLGKNSIIYELAQGDEFSEITEEAVLTGHEKKEDNFLYLILPGEQLMDQLPDEKTPTTTEGNILDSSITKNTRIVTDESQLDNLIASNSMINNDAVSKTSSPETEEVPKPRQDAITYTVESGDTISSIAKKFGVSINTVLWENKLSGLSVIRPGDELSILPISGTSHTVAKNDTLSSIAKKYSAETDKILAYNKLISADQLQIGQKIIIPGGSVTAPTRSIRTVTSVFSNPASVGSSSSRNVGGFIWPTVSKTITQYYHWRHHGLDIGSKPGLPIYASMAGTVTKAGWGTGYGNYVKIDHGGGKQSLYGHMSKIYVEKGQEVNQGDAIGAIGSTGWSTGPHLHFEIIINGGKVNPLSYL